MCFQHVLKHLGNNKRVWEPLFPDLWLWSGFKFHGSPSDFIRLRTAGWKILHHFSINHFFRNRIKASSVWSKKGKKNPSDKFYYFKIYFKTKDRNDICKEIGRHCGYVSAGLSSGNSVTWTLWCSKNCRLEPCYLIPLKKSLAPLSAKEGKKKT